MRRYMNWLGRERGLALGGYGQLWQWSVDHPNEFWASIWEFFDLPGRPPLQVLAERSMPGAQWFPGAHLNYAEQIFRQASSERPALLFQSERQPLTALSWAELAASVASVATALRAMGVGPGDRVVGYLPNMPQSVVALLACASLGAVWSSCSPDFGTSSAVNRFQQIEPSVLIAVDGYQYNGKPFNRLPVVAEIQAALPALQKTILVPYLNPSAGGGNLADTVRWDDLLRTPGELQFQPVPFDHPLWVLYSSGTTGLPKAIVQGHGGIVLAHLSAAGLHSDVRPGDRFFWFTTTGWVMWNFLIGNLLLGATIVLYDGSPGYPDLEVLWKLAEAAGVTTFGTSPGFIASCGKGGIEPARHDLGPLRCLGCTGSPLPPEGSQWVYDHVKRDLWLSLFSGGTDLYSPLVGGCPLLPVRAGEMQCRYLGAKVEAWNDEGQPVVDEVGELVITEPMPSMPLYFWNDPGGQRYRDSYFSFWPGIWRHGDWIKITPEGSVVIYGRSDSTLNRLGVRMGSSEIYRVVEALPEVVDSVVLGIEQPGGGYYMPLFVVLAKGDELDETLRKRINGAIRAQLTPRHVPDEIIAVPDVPRTISGKKLEVPLKKILMGVPAEKAASAGSLANPGSLQYFVDLAQARSGG
jgi:acetoacetyl-CoA synthetase